jgi:Reverse transcriptase (RNA-dependent DNA polymerase)
VILRTGQIPSKLKAACVTPLYKGAGSRIETGSYRPISCLPLLAKILERVVVVKLKMAVLDKLDVNQHGFRPGHSCETALTKFTDYVYRELDKPNYVVGAVFVDLKKAFNSMDHVKLLFKLRDRMRIPTVLFRFMCNYLLNRTFVIRLDKIISRVYDVLRGVPQGSSLGPLLFILYINDLFIVLEGYDYTLYADDLCVYVASNSLKEIEIALNVVLVKLGLWFKEHDLELSADKTKYMLFRKPSTKNLL